MLEQWLAKKEYDPLSKEEELELKAKIVDDSSKEIDILVQHNLRLIYKAATKYLKTPEYIAEGIPAARKAILDWNPEKGSLSTVIYLYVSRKVFDKGLRIENRYSSRYQVTENEILEICPEFNNNPSYEMSSMDLLVSNLRAEEAAYINAIYYKNMDSRDVARSFGTTKKNVEEVVDTGLTKLRSILEEIGEVPDNMNNA